MSENFQSTPNFGTKSTLQLSLPVLKNSTPSGMVCNYTSVSFPPVSSAWLLPSASSTSLQPLMGSDYLNPNSSMTMLTMLSDQSQVSNSTLSCPVVEMDTSLGLSPSSQTLCLLQSPEFYITCTPVSQRKTPSVDGDGPLTTSIPSHSEFLALPPAPSAEQTEIKNMHEMEVEHLMPRDAYKGTKENQDPSFLPLSHPDLQQPLHCIDTGNLRQTSASDNDSLGGIHLGLEEKGTLDSLKVSTIDFPDITTLVADIHLPQLFKFLTGLDQYQDSTVTESKDSTVVWRDQAQENSRVISGSSDQVKKKDHDTSELIDGAPHAKIPNWDLVVGEGSMASVGVSGRAIDNMAKDLEGKAPKVSPIMPSRARGQGQDKTKWTTENNSKKIEELKKSRNRAKAEKKPTIPKTKIKRDLPELSHSSFKKPRTHLGMHMLESVQVFHPLGKKSEKKPATTSSQHLGTSSSNKYPGPGPATTVLQDMAHECQGPDETPGKVQRAESSALKECPSQSQYEVPPAGKVRLVPLPFPTQDQPQTRPVSRKPLNLASHRPTTAYSERCHFHSAQLTTLKPSQPPSISKSLMASAKPALPISSSAMRSNVTNIIHISTVPQSGTLRPTSYREPSQTSLQRELLSAAKNNVPAPLEPQTQYLLQDFSRQPIPWRKVDILGPVVSQPITKEQRPEREAMKRRAQQERENAAKYTSPGKLQLFLQREKDMEISRYYGYAM
uniref:RIKEN cDNA 4930433I11 gene n=1 Tax=Mus musculus TaxID=10090 RepID=A0A0U1RPT6_MOUSE